MQPCKDITRTNGTSYFGDNVVTTLRHMKTVLGEPTHTSSSKFDKVNVEWAMEDKEGNVFTVYSWKYYREINDDDVVEWHIGGHGALVTERNRYRLLALLEDELSKWHDVQTYDVRSRWTCHDCKTECYLPPSAYEHNGTPVCEECGDDMGYYGTQVRAYRIE